MKKADGVSPDQAIKACQFWAGLEYMNLATAPDPDERRVFRVRSDDELPWRSPSRKPSLTGWKTRYKAQVAYCGLFAKRDHAVSLRNALGAAQLDPKAMRQAGDGAVVLIPLDDTGRVCGEVFISSMPWMMARVRDILLLSSDRTIGAFLGFEDFMESLMGEVRDLLVEMQLIREQDARKQEQSGRGDPSVDMEAGKLCGPRDMRPLSLDHVRRLLALIWRRSGWQPDWGPHARQDVLEDEPSMQDCAHLARFKVVTLTKFKDRKIDLGAMNSMVAPDVERVRQLLFEGEAIGPALQSYLKLSTPPRRVDLRDGDAAGGLGVFANALCPTWLPAGAWPDFPLVTAQQFAVNASRTHLAEGGLYGINGPPGTGKSTLLRDVVADALVTKAERLASYDDPLTAFQASAAIEGSKFNYWTLDPALHGHGVVVASSNNGAVENVIAELPKLSGSIDQVGLSYFREVSDSIAAPPKAERRAVGSTWGLVAALLGSSDRKRAFWKRFWFEVSPKADEAPDPLRLRSLRGLVEQAEHGALDWDDARKDFLNILKRCRQRSNDLERYAKAYAQCHALGHQLGLAVEQLQALQTVHGENGKTVERLNDGVAHAATRLVAYCAFTAGRSAAAAAEQTLREARSATTPDAVHEASMAEDDAQRELEAAMRRTELVLAAKPGLLETLFRWSAPRQWRAGLQEASDNESAGRRKVSETKSAIRAALAAAERCRVAEKQLRALVDQVEAAASAMVQAGLPTDMDEASANGLECDHEELTHRLKVALDRAALSAAEVHERETLVQELQVASTEAEQRLKRWDEQLGGVPEAFLDTADLLGKSDEALQRLVAHNDPELRSLRIEVFRCAMRLTEAFVVKAWKRLGRNLSVCCDYQTGRMSEAMAAAAAPHLWNTFFLVVPVVSSTFASVGRLFQGLGREALGTLLIDEAGQSTPQNALGAIWRSRCVIAVGDPLQLEPVVPQPIEAVSAWREWIGADMGWAAPRCSTQTLADDATPYGTYLSAGGLATNKVWVGSPLRVHRRCLNPMFRAANEIVYDHLMVHDVTDDTTADDWRGHSRWFDVQGEGMGHWIREQGEFACGLIDDLLATGKLGGSLTNHKGDFHINVITPYKDVSTEFLSLARERFRGEENLHKMCGTVHTFQGKEADVVILLLGGNPEKPGAISTFAGDEQSPNLLNVALTRAKKRLYVVGDKRLWTGNSATFRRLAQILDQHERGALAGGGLDSGASAVSAILPPVPAVSC